PDTLAPEIYPLSLHDALPISERFSWGAARHSREGPCNDSRDRKRRRNGPVRLGPFPPSRLSTRPPASPKRKNRAWEALESYRSPVVSLCLEAPKAAPGRLDKAI